MHPGLRHYYYYSSSSEASHDDVYAAYGTDFDDLLLPEGVTWTEGDYDPLTEGTYAISGSGGNTVNVIVEKFALKLEPANLATLLQAGRTEDYIGGVTTDGQSVGTIYDLGRGIPVGTLGTAEPTLTSHSNFSTFITTSAATPIHISGYRKYFQSLHGAASPVWSIQFIWKFESGSNGVLKTMFNNTLLAGTTATDAGIFVRRTTGNKLQIIMRKKVSGQTMINYTSTADFNEASGVIRCTININGAGTGTGIIHIKNDNAVDTSEAFDVLAGNNIITDGLRFSFLGSSLQSMGAFRMRDRLCTTEEITAWKTYNPARHSTPFLIKERDYDLRQQSKVFSDASGTVQVTDGGNIRYVKDNAPSPFGELPEYTSAADASAPIWRENAGASYGELDGARNIDLESPICAEGSGKFTLFVVGRNTDDTFGSHFVSGGSSTDQYMVVTGVNYAGAPELDKPYMVIHPDSAFATSIGEIPSADGTDNVFVFIRNGSDCKLLNNSLTEPFEDTDVNSFIVNDLGFSANDDGDWNHEGRMYRVIKYSGVMSEARALAIRDELKTLYGIA